jgi:hypothetical protein
VTLARRFLPALSLGAAILVVGGSAVYAQLEGGERGVPPIESASTLEVTGVEVDTSGKTSEEARIAGWREAQAKGWRVLWAKSTGRPPSEAPALAGSALDALVSGIVIEHEQIGPTRYIARLGVLFDRSRTAPLLGGGEGVVRHSAPMLVIPVMATGSTYQSLEARTEWQKAWARFRTGGSAIDYVRPVGTGIDPLLLNVMQTGRPGRGWWRMLLDQYGASDVIVPEVQLRRAFPGGPALATFIARHGADNQILESFTLRAANSAAIPRMMDEGVRRLDGAYTRAFNMGLLAPDPSLTVEDTSVLDIIAAQIEAEAEAPRISVAPPPAPTQQQPSGAVTTLTVDVATPGAADIGAAELAVSRVAGVTSAITINRVAGGTSNMRVTFTGDADALATALRGQGWTVTVSGNALRISRASAAPAGAPEGGA